MTQELEQRLGADSQPYINIPRTRGGRILWKSFKETPEDFKLYAHEEAKKVVDQLGRVTNETLLESGRSSLAVAINRYYPGGMLQLKLDIGFAQDLAPLKSPEEIERFIEDRIKDKASQRADKSNRVNVPKDSSGRVLWSRLRYSPDQLMLAVEQQAKDFFDKSGALTNQTLQADNRSNLINAINSYYPGGMYGLKRVLGLERATKPNGYWTNEMTEAAALEFYQEHKTLSQKVVAKFNRQDLNGAINTYPGRLIGLQSKLGLARGRKDTKYWDDDTNIETELRKFIDKNGGFPSVAELKKQNSSLSLALNKQGMLYWRKKFGLPITERPKNYWKNSENIRHELEQTAKKLGHFPTPKDMRKLQLGGLVRGIVQTGGFRYWQDLLGFEHNQPTQKGFWTYDKVAEQLTNTITSLGHFPSERELIDHFGSHGLAVAISKRGGLGKWKQNLGFAQNLDEIEINQEHANDQLKSLLEGGSK